MADDWLLVALDDVERGAHRLIDTLGPVGDVLAQARKQRNEGASVVDIATELSARGAVPRRTVDEAIDGYRMAMAVLRAKVVRVLVDEEGATRSQIAQQMSISRQMVTRLYEAAGDPEHWDQGP